MSLPARGPSKLRQFFRRLINESYAKAADYIVIKLNLLLPYFSRFYIADHGAAYSERASDNSAGDLML